MFFHIIKNVTCQRCYNVRTYCNAVNKLPRYGSKYYPRFPNEEDAPWDRTKLFMVQRVKSYKGIPYWEKNILEELGLMVKMGEIAVVKNTPEMNAHLWKVKHLIKITPITFPNGEPSEEDLGATYLKENGELLISKLVEISKERLEATEKFANDISKMDRETLRKQLRYQWLNPRFNPVN